MLRSAHISRVAPNIRIVLLQERRALLDDYYNYGSCYGKPAAMCTLALIEQRSAVLSMADLWCARGALRCTCSHACRCVARASQVNCGQHVAMCMDNPLDTRTLC